MSDGTHLLVVAQGGYTDHPEESWQCGIRYSYDTGTGAPPDTGALYPFGVVPDATVTAGALWTTSNEFLAINGTHTLRPDDWLTNQLAPAFTAWMGAAHISSKCRLDSLKVSPIGSNGKVVPRSGTPGDLGVSRLDWTSSNPVGGTGGNMVPPEVSIATSWVTPVIGRRGRGRIYPPPTGVGSIDADGMVLDSVCTDNRDAAVTLLEDGAITGALLSGQWVLPIVTGSPWTQYGRITGVRVGHVFDRQGRRRRSLVEAWDAAPVSY